MICGLCSMSYLIFKCLMNWSKSGYQTNSWSPSEPLFINFILKHFYQINIFSAKEFFWLLCQLGQVWLDMLISISRKLFTKPRPRQLRQLRIMRPYQNLKKLQSPLNLSREWWEIFQRDIQARPIAFLSGYIHFIQTRNNSIDNPYYKRALYAPAGTWVFDVDTNSNNNRWLAVIRNWYIIVIRNFRSCVENKTIRECLWAKGELQCNRDS